MDKDIQQYAELHTSPESDLLKKIERETHLTVLKPRMLSGRLQGRFLAMFSHLVSPMQILEIGTYTGYSALCLLEGLRPEGRLITIDRNDELAEKVRSYFGQSPRAAQINYQIGNAMDLIPTLGGPFELVFIDADKESNGLYYDLVVDKVPVGGYLIVDNVLWSGKVLDRAPDRDTKTIMAFNTKIQMDPRVDNLMLPLRDGLMIIRKVAQ